MRHKPRMTAMHRFMTMRLPGGSIDYKRRIMDDELIIQCCICAWKTVKTKLGAKCLSCGGKVVKIEKDFPPVRAGWGF